MILIVSWQDDITAQAVVDALERLGRRDVLWVDLERAFEELSVTLNATAAGVTWTLRSRRDPALSVNPAQISAVYWRRVVKTQDSPMLGLPTTANLDQYEMFWSLRWMLEALPSSQFPLGHPYTHGQGENKHRQLETARQVGFVTPETCHSNNLEDLRQFIASQKEIAVKAMKIPALTQSGIYENVRHIACKAFPSDFLLEKLRTVERTQLYCQQVIPRKRDLRIMVFPRELVAVELDLSGLAPDKLDWREESLELPHRVVPVAPEFERQLRAYLDLMGLTTGFFDFAVPDEGPPVFFECNTNAQWYWIEKVTGHPISEVVARELLRCSERCA